MLLACFQVVRVVFGFFAVALGWVLIQTNIAGVATQADMPRFPQLTFFAAVSIVLCSGWIVLSTFARPRRRIACVSWSLLAAVAVVSAGLALSGAFAKGPWVDYEPSRAGFTWLVCSAALGALLTVRSMREEGWSGLRRLLRLAPPARPGKAHSDASTVACPSPAAQPPAPQAPHPGQAL